MNVNAPAVNSTSNAGPVEAPELTPSEYAKSASNLKLGAYLFTNFETFADPKNEGYITVDSLRKLAYWGPPYAHNVAKEILKRHDFMYALDVDGKGLLDSK